MNMVVDTYVIVSALINANGTSAKILSLILSGNIKSYTTIELFLSILTY